MHLGKVAFALLAASSLGVSGIAGAATARSTSRRGHVATAPACKAGQVAVWIETQGNGAAGSFYYNLEFTNVSTRPCTLVGYPGVSGVNVGGRQLGAPASRDRSQAAFAVRLSGAPVAAGGPVGLGGTVTAVLRIVDADNYPAARCGRATAAGLRVYAPGQTVARFVAMPFLACARAQAPYLSVGPVRSGTLPQ